MVLRFLILLLIILTACSTNKLASEEMSYDLLTLTKNMGYTLTKTGTSEKSILQTLPSTTGEVMRSVILLQNNDRLAAVWWKSSRNSVNDFGYIKQIIFAKLSSKTQDVVDEVIDREGHAAIQLLTFTDDSLHEDRIILASIRDLLFEFHVLEDGMDEILRITEEISKEKN